MAQPQGSQRRILAISQRRGGVRVGRSFAAPGLVANCGERAAAGVCARNGLVGPRWLCGWSRAEPCLRCEEGFGSKKLVTLCTTLVPRTPQLPRFTCGCSQYKALAVCKILAR